MIATIKTGARLFKAAIKQIQGKKKKISRTINKASCKAKRICSKLWNKLRSFFADFFQNNNKKPDSSCIEINFKRESELRSKHAKKKNLSYGLSELSYRLSVSAWRYPHRDIIRGDASARFGMTGISSLNPSGNRVVSSVNPNGMTDFSSVDPLGKTGISLVKTQDKQEAINEKAEPEKVITLSVEAIKDFYREWEENWGPALNSLDKEFLESANSETVAKVIANGRLTLKSPYLKAVYNGLRDLVDISDLLENDQLAKQKLLPFFKDYWERKPEKFGEVLLAMHDKGVFPTRSGERRLSLDPRLVPEWLGLAS